jgi:hypothetical protein
VKREAERLLDLAGAAADGARVDWESEVERSHGPRERDVVRALGFVAAVLDAHGTLHGRRDAAAPDELPDGAAWGGLEGLEAIGRGSAGTVYRARDPRLGRPVALKLRAAPADRSTEAAAEGRMLARVRHPNVVTVHGAEVHEGRFGLWMEHVDGVTLAADLRTRGPFGPGEVVAIGRDLCGALAAVHAAGLVHGDVKAQNVMRESGGRIVLMDFSAGADAGVEGGEVSGTPLYLAPELLAGGPKTARSDVYALGVLLYHLLTGRHPVEAESVAALREAHVAGRATPLRDRRPDVPAPLVDAIERALAADPAARHSSAGELERALSGARATAAPPAARRLAVAVAALAGVAVLVALGVIALRDADVRRPAPVSAPTVEAGSAALAAQVETVLYRAGMAVDQPLGAGDRVRPGDRLYLEVRPREPVHVYVVNLDEAGRGYLLFPLPEAQAENPLRPGAVHRLPGDSTSDYDTWEVTSAGGRESFLVVAARRPLDVLEDAVAGLPRATPAGPPEVGAAMLEALRGIGRLSRAGSAAAGSAEAAAVAEALATLTSSPASRELIVVREIVLDNPRDAP